MDVARIHRVSFSYDGTDLALDDLSLAIDSGELIGVLGGNGSGKSTLARHLDALLVPDSGYVEVLGKRTDDPDNLFFIRSNAGMVFQNPDDQIVASIIEDDVAFGPENLGLDPSEIAERVERALERVGMKGFEEHETAALSGGQKQRVALAGVLAMSPKLLVLDEAGAMLDPRGRKGLLKLCRSLNDEGFTVVLITHSMEEAATCHRIVVLDQGKVALSGTPEEILPKAKELMNLHLAVPFAVELCLELQRRNVPIATCITLPELIGQLQGLPRVKAPTLRCNGTGAEEDSLSATLTKEATKPLMVFDDVSFAYGKKPKRTKGATASERAWGNEPDDAWALRHVSFTLNEGEFLGIAGHTGSGKSTLLQLANGLLQPLEGSVTIDGKSLASKRAATEARRKVGLVFQYPEHQLFAPTVIEDVAFGPRNLGLDAKEVDARVSRALERVHLSKEAIGSKSPFALSGGQQRRVALAGVLAMEPSVLILDEPTVGLDPQGHERLLDLICELHEVRGLTVAMVSHNMDALAQLCDRMIILNKGELVAEGTPTEVFSHGLELESIGLGLPQSLQVANALELSSCFETIPTTSELASVIAQHYEGTPSSYTCIDPVSMTSDASPGDVDRP